jgi:hypothetical protein
VADSRDKALFTTCNQLQARDSVVILHDVNNSNSRVHITNLVLWDGDRVDLVGSLQSIRPLS